jgi:hypothetical protein
MPIDIHKELGRRQIFRDFEAVLRKVRSVYPEAYAEGSTGPERSWWIRTDDGMILIGHSWPIRSSKPQNEQYLRLKTDLDEWDRNVTPS